MYTIHAVYPNGRPDYKGRASNLSTAEKAVRNIISAGGYLYVKVWDKNGKIIFESGKKDIIK